jgi:hypothetical protein
MKKSTLLILVFFLCATSTFAGGGQLKKYLKSVSFERGMVYFIKPFDYSSSNKDITVAPDFTYALYKDSVNPYVTMNFSVYQKTGIRVFEKVEIADVTSVKYTSDTLERFYSEPVDKVWENRFSTPLKLSDFISFLRSNNQFINLYYDGTVVTIKVPKKIKKGMLLSAATLEVSATGKY